MSSGNLERHFFCLPVVRNDDRFLPDESQTDALQDLPSYGEIVDYLNRHYRRTKGSLEWKGRNLFTEIFLPNDVDDCSYALLHPSIFEEHQQGLEEPDTANSSLRRWSMENIADAEPAPTGNSTRIPTEFVDVMLRAWNGIDAHGPIFGWKTLLDRTRVIVSGGPGSGKTTLLRSITLSEANRHAMKLQSRLPIYIPLRNIGACTDLMALARATFAEQVKDGAHDAFERAFRSGSLLVLLDGLDEMSDSIRHIWRETIFQASQKYPALGIYVGTRDWGYDFQFPGFLHAQIQPFSQAQIQDWIHLRLSRSNRNFAEELKLALTGDSDLSELASTPLTLSLIASVYERNGNVPRRKTDLIARYLEAMLETWDSSRSVRRYEVNYLREDKLEALSIAAVAAWRESRLHFSEEDFLTAQQSWSPFKEHISAARVLRDSGLFALKGHDRVWEFTHQLFRDYLAAYYLVQSPSRIAQWLADRDDDSKHLDLWRYACGIATDPTALLRTLIADRKMRSLDKAHWLLSAMCDGVNAPDEEVRDAVVLILSALESDSISQWVINMITEPSVWKLEINGPNREAETLSEVVRLIAGGGWRSSRWLSERLKRSPVAWIAGLSRVAETRWRIKKLVDSGANEIHMSGEHSDPIQG